MFTVGRVRQQLPTCCLIVCWWAEQNVISCPELRWTSPHHQHDLRRTTPDSVSNVDTLPGFYRKSVELQDGVSLTEPSLMSRTSWIHSLDSDRTVAADRESKTIFSSNNTHLRQTLSNADSTQTVDCVHVGLDPDAPTVHQILQQTLTTANQDQEPGLTHGRPRPL